MGWFRFDDKAIDNPKLLALSDGAFRLWIEGGAYCNRHLTDGLITRAALNGFRYVTRKRVEELTVALWDTDGDAFQMHDYLIWNECKEDVLQKKADARERSRTYRARALHVLSGLSTTPSESLKERRSAETFDAFWLRYPRKVGRAAAAKAFARVDPDDALLATILAALERQARQPQWTKDAGQFIPHASTWLNARRWEDEVTTGPKPVGSASDLSWMDDCRELHGSDCGSHYKHDLRMKLDAMKAEARTA